MVGSSHSLALLGSRSRITRLPNSLGELNPYTTTSFQILPGIQQIAHLDNNEFHTHENICLRNVGFLRPFYM